MKEEGPGVRRVRLPAINGPNGVLIEKNEI
jgi:hypothetical protein